jgi:PIN domain nuclease of toxin-antitoxin system
MNVFDASALLAYLLGEPGSDQVEAALKQGAVCSAANWSETAQEVIGRGGSWLTAKAILSSFDLTVEPVTAADAETAAALWPAHRHLSLGDRLCIALAGRLDAWVFTADRAWTDAYGRVQIVR